MMVLPLALCFALNSITLYNRPPALVPPHLRAEPGSHEIRRRRRAR